MNRREFSKTALMLGLGAEVGLGQDNPVTPSSTDRYEEQARSLPVRQYDVVVAGGGTAGVVAALAAARQGAKTVLIESKGYTGGTVVEGGTALHSFFNLWKAFPGVEKRQVVRGIPDEIIGRLVKAGAATGYPEMEQGYGYDSVCTAIDTEMYKLTTMEMLEEAGVTMALNTLLVGAIAEGSRLKGVIMESRSGREAICGRCFVDCTGYGDLAARGGARFSEPNDYAVCNSFGLANVDVEKYHEFLKSHNAGGQLCKGLRDGRPDQIIRLGGESVSLPGGMTEAARAIGMAMITTTVHDNYFMFVKCNLKLPVSPTRRDAVAKAELQIRRNMAKAVDVFRKYVPGCEKAFMARTSPSLCIRRARLIECDYDLSLKDVLEARHFEDEVFVYGFHDSAPACRSRMEGPMASPTGLCGSASSTTCWLRA